MAYEKDPNEIGALWVREGAKGCYLTGEINGVKVVCFENRSKNPKAPTWRVLKSQPKGERATPESTGYQPYQDGEDVPF